MIFNTPCGLTIKRATAFSRAIGDAANKTGHQSATKRLLNGQSHHRSPSNWKHNGTPEIVIGITILSLLGIDHYLQKKHDETRQLVMSQLHAVIREDEIIEKERNQQNKADFEMRDMKCLFLCTVRRLPKYFDGSKCLMGVKLGDQVSVLEENVGPDGMYHLCRHEKNCNGNNTAVSIGWFPISCLEKQSY